jgi:hypothetical protein
MARSSFGSGIGEGKISPIGDNRYGMREEYDPEVMKKTKEYYRRGDELTIKEVKNPYSQTIKTLKK